MMDLASEKHISLDQIHLSDWMRKKAFEELGEDESTRERCLKELRAKLQALKDAYCPSNDVYLLQFLRYRKFNTNDAFDSMIKAARFKENFYNIFHIPNIPAVLKTFESHTISVLPYRDMDGAMIRIIHVDKWNVEDVSLEDLIHGGSLEMLCALGFDEVTQVCGMTWIFDLKGMSTAKLRQTTVRLLKLLTQSFSKYIPTRMRAVHFCNEPAVFPYIWSIIEHFLSPKLRNRIFFHSKNMKSLHKHIDPEILPEELGGKLKYDNSCMKRIEMILHEKYDEEITVGFTVKSEKCK